MTPRFESIFSAFLIYIALPLCWSTTFLGTQLAMHAFPPLWLGALRYMGATLVYLVVLLSITPLRVILNDGRREWKGLCLIGLSGVFLAIIFQNMGLQSTTSSHASLLSVMEPVLVALFAVLFLRERISRIASLGLGVAILGTLLVVSDGRWPSLGAWGGTMKGNIYILISLVAYAAFTIFSKQVLNHASVLSVVTLSSLFGTALLTLGACVVETAPVFSNITPAGWGALLYLVLFPTCMAYFLYYWLLQKVLATRLTVVLFLIPVYGVILGALIMHDRPSIHVYFGGFVAILGAMVLDRAMAARQHQKTAEGRDHSFLKPCK